MQIGSSPADGDTLVFAFADYEVGDGNREESEGAHLKFVMLPVPLGLVLEKSNEFLFECLFWLFGELEILSLLISTRTPWCSFRTAFCLSCIICGPIWIISCCILLGSSELVSLATILTLIRHIERFMGTNLLDVLDEPNYNANEYQL